MRVKHPGLVCGASCEGLHRDVCGERARCNVNMLRRYQDEPAWASSSTIPPGCCSLVCKKLNVGAIDRSICLVQEAKGEAVLLQGLSYVPLSSSSKLDRSRNKHRHYHRHRHGNSSSSSSCSHCSSDDDDDASSPCLQFQSPACCDDQRERPAQNSAPNPLSCYPM